MFSSDLSDPQSRVMFAVGDTGSTQLLSDATYAALLSQTRARVVDVAATAADSRLTAQDHGYRARQALILSDLSGAIGVGAGTVYYVRDVLDDSFGLALATTGAARTITADGAAVAGLVDEIAATKAAASALAVRYAQQPDSLSDAGSAIRWGERVAQWNRIAAGEIPAGVASILGAGKARGFTLRRGPARDYSTGGGDAE